MATIAPKRPETDIRLGLNGFLGFCELIGLETESYTRRIARAYFGTVREISVVLATSNGKTTGGGVDSAARLVDGEGRVDRGGGVVRARPGSRSSPHHPPPRRPRPRTNRQSRRHPLSQAGFDGDFETRMLSWGEEILRGYGTTEEVSR